MSTPAGWYPDPAGQRGMERYWDGTRWTDQLAPEAPGVPRPLTGPLQEPGQAPPQPPRRRRTGLWIAVASLAAILALVAGMLLRDNGGEQADPDPTTTATGWDEKPTPSTSSTQPTASATQSATTVACGLNQPNKLDDPAESGGRLRVGEVSMPAPQGWDGPRGEGRLPMARDVWSYYEVLPEKLAWASSVQLGVVTDDAPADSTALAKGLIECISTSDFYTSVDVKVDSITVTKLTIDGTAAVQADTTLHFKHDDLKTTGSKLRVIIVDTPTRHVFFSAVPKENKEHIAIVESTTKGLKIES